MISPIQTSTSPGASPSSGSGASSGAVNLSGQFSQFLGQAINQLNQQENTVNQLSAEYMTGNLQDTHQLMIASEKSLIGLDLAVQVRDKVISAYQEIMRMQI